MTIYLILLLVLVVSGAASVHGSRFVLSGHHGTIRAHEYDPPEPARPW